MLGLSSPVRFLLALSLVVPVLGRAGTASAGLVDTSIQVPSILLNDIGRTSGDSLAIRGIVEVNPGDDPVAGGIAGGAMAIVYQTGASAGALALVESISFSASQCRSLGRGRSLLCRDAAGNFLALRGGAAPQTYRVQVRVRRLEFSPGRPFALPLAAEVQVNGFDWIGAGDTCRVTQNSTRTTCRADWGGPG